MSDIDGILEMLEWNNDEETQRKGRELAADIKVLNVFFQPVYSDNSKSVWDNCARILSERSDDELSPYATKLFEWLMDINWPGALVILERLKSFEKVERIKSPLVDCTKRAYLTDDIVWLSNLSELLNNQKLKAELPYDTLQVLAEYYQYLEKEEHLE